MPRKPSPEIEPQLRRRAEAAIHLAHEWMSLMSASQRGLARLLGIDQSMLSRFLSQQPGYEPTSRRPRILKLLEDIEQVCSRVEDIAPYSEDGPFDPEDDLFRWECTLALRLRQLRGFEDPGSALTRLPELTIQALHMTGTSRVNACINASLSAAVLMATEWRLRVCSVTLIEQTLRRLDALEATALETLSSLDGIEDSVRSRHRARSLSYCGTARSYAALRLGDATLLDRAVAQQLEACTRTLDPKDGVWKNLLTLLNTLLEQGHEDAQRFADRGSEVARENPSRALAMALIDRELASLESYWADTAPDILEDEQQ